MRCCGQGAGSWAADRAFALSWALSERSLRTSFAAAHRLDPLGQCAKPDIEVGLVRKVVDFQRGEGLACRFEDVARVFEAQCVIAAAERLQAHKIDLRILGSEASEACKVLARFPWRAIRVMRSTRRPRIRACGAQDGEPQLRKHRIDSPHKARIGVVGAPGNHDSVPLCVLGKPVDYLPVRLCDRVEECPLRCERLFEDVVEFFAGKRRAVRAEASHLGKECREVVLVLCNARHFERRETGSREANLPLFKRGYGICERIGVFARHRAASDAVEAGHENDVRTCVHQVECPHMRNLCGKTCTFGGDGCECRLFE